MTASTGSLEAVPEGVIAEFAESKASTKPSLGALVQSRPARQRARDRLLAAVFMASRLRRHRSFQPREAELDIFDK